MEYDKRALSGRAALLVVKSAQAGEKATALPLADASITVNAASPQSLCGSAPSKQPPTQEPPPTFQIDGERELILVETHEALRSAVEALSDEPLLAIDAEGVPATVALLQIATSTRVYLLDGVQLGGDVIRIAHSALLHPNTRVTCHTRLLDATRLVWGPLGALRVAKLAPLEQELLVRRAVEEVPPA